MDRRAVPASGRPESAGACGYAGSRLVARAGRDRRGDGVSTERERLQVAYEATAYRVDEGPGGPFVIRVGARSVAADARLAAAGADAWAFITACNPGSTPLPAADNEARMTRLGRVVRDRGLVTYAGAGAGPDAGWPPEPSLFVVGLDERDAVALAREFGQLAIVVGRCGAPARLVWVDDGDAGC